jgi:phosphatidylglycerol:prolipoprotein diacylglycerol transferase
MKESWQNLYSTFEPVAFNIFSLSVHWYGLMYALALIIAIYTAHYIIKKDNMDISKDTLDSYIWWAEIGVILGARIGYILFYDTNPMYYILQPWEIFNPFSNGEFVGISGMSYHGALIGFIISTILFSRKYKISFWFLSDIAALSVPLAYIFGRIANFMNQELIGRASELPWAIYAQGMLRHPSQLYEAFLEGFVVFVILYFYRTKTSINGQLALLYVILYSFMRILAENFRQPDAQLGFLLGTSWLTMGILISLGFMIGTATLFIYRQQTVK